MSPILSPTQIPATPDVVVLVVLVVVPVVFLFAAYKLMQGLLAFDRRGQNGA
jgi:hypothetical protein